jgi:hypothetical protein
MGSTALETTMKKWVAVVLAVVAFALIALALIALALIALAFMLPTSVPRPTPSTSCPEMNDGNFVELDKDCYGDGKGDWCILFDYQPGRLDTIKCTRVVAV